MCAYMQNVHFIFLIDNNIAQITTVLWHFVFGVFCLCVCFCAKVVVLSVKAEVFVFVTELVGVRDPSKPA